MSRLALYFHTVRHLRVEQIVGRLCYRLRRPRLQSTQALPLRQPTGEFVEPVRPAPSLLAPDVFRFLHVERRCSTAADWVSGHPDKLWCYNLHYFDDLNAEYSAERQAWHRALIARWIAENPVGHGDGWEPYPLSRRMVNWVKWAASGTQLSETATRSLACQARWLMQRLEYHILGNHLFMNGKALLHAGLFFSGPEAEQWLAKGMQIVAREIKEQVLKDGGHFELSTMYHAAMIEDLLDVINLYRHYGRQVPSHWPESVQKMLHWLDAMTHPDGQLSFFNDSAFGIAPTAAQLHRYSRRVGLSNSPASERPLTALTASGYARLHAGPATVFCDFAAVGPAYQPGHAHADTLSFELSLYASRVLVNSGTSRYGMDAERHRQRATAAHNTVVLDGQDSSEIWAGFRVARRARAKLHQLMGELPAGLQASHDGYRRLRGRNEHMRTWQLTADALTIDDRISGRYESAVAYFHLHPDITLVERAGDGVILKTRDNTIVRIAFSGAQRIEVGEGTWHPEFGMSLANRHILVQFAGGELGTRITWTVA